MVTYTIRYTKQAQKDAKKVASSGLKQKVIVILELLKKDPFIKYPPYEKLIGDLLGAYSRRINILHRLVYKVFEKEKVVLVLRMWSHYE